MARLSMRGMNGAESNSSPESLLGFFKGVGESIAAYRLPMIEWLPGYSVHDLYNDMNAGVTVFVLLVPQGMAYALLAGVPPVYGLNCATVPLIVYTLLGSSRQLSLGAMALTSLLSAEVVSDLGYEPESAEYIHASQSLALLTGICLTLMGILQMGNLTNLLSPSVLTGFITGGAAVIFLSQLKHIFGLSVNRGRYSHEILYRICVNIPELSPLALAIGIASVIVLLGIKKWRQWYKKQDKSTRSEWNDRLYMISNSAQLFVVFFTTVISYVVHKSSSLRIPIVGHVPAGLKTPTFVGLDIRLLPGAVAISLISFAGNWAVGKQFAKGYTLSAASELFATGAGNIASSIFNGFIVSGGLSRSAVNAEAGAVTPMAGTISAIFMILAIQFLTPLFHFLPMATLGAIIEVSVVSMIDIASIKKAYDTKSYSDCFVMCTTACVVFFLDINIGLVVGILLSFLVFLYYNIYPDIAFEQFLPSHYSNCFADKEKGADNDGYGYFNAVIKTTAPLFFGNCEVVVDSALDTLRDIHCSSDISGESTGIVFMDASSWGRHIDMPSVAAIRKVAEEAESYDKPKLKIGFLNLHDNCLQTLVNHGVVGNIDTCSIGYELVVRDLHAYENLMPPCAQSGEVSLGERKEIEI